MSTMAINTTGFSALAFLAPVAKAESRKFGITTADIGRYRAHKKRRKHDTIPSWVIASAIDALLGDRLIAGFFGGVLGHGISVQKENDLAQVIESLTEMFEGATESAWDMTTGDDLAQKVENNETQISNVPKKINENQTTDTNTPANLLSWRQQKAEKKLDQCALGYHNTLKFVAP